MPLKHRPVVLTVDGDPWYVFQVREEMREWLLFISGPLRRKRRLLEFPAGWAELGEADLRYLWGKATEVPPPPTTGVRR